MSKGTHIQTSGHRHRIESRRLGCGLLVAFILGFGEGAAVTFFLIQKNSAAKAALSVTTFAAIVVIVLICSRRAKSNG